MNTAPRPLILVVDDEPGVRLVVSALLRQAGYDCLTAEDAKQGLRVVREQPIDAVLTDLQMPGEDGFWLIQQLRSEAPFLPVIVLSAHATVDNAVRAMHKGAFDFLPKPVDQEALKQCIAKAVPVSARQFRDGSPLDLVAQSPAMRKVLQLCERMGPSQAPVLITGPSGSGKEVVARHLHSLGGSQRPFVAVNCGAIPAGLIESELFGHSKGAFTGAVSDKPGRIELAEGGVLFLDEIGDLPLEAQVKILRLIQEKTYERVGGLGSRTANIRIIAATHRDLPLMVRDEKFREDLFFRLNVLPIQLAPLQERSEDIVPLAQAFLAQAVKDGQRPPPRLDPTAITALYAQAWPGNARELGNLMERVAVLCPGPTINAEEIQDCLTLGQTLHQNKDAAGEDESSLSFGSHDPRQAIEQALAHTGGNRSQAAKLLGVSRRTLYNRLERLGITTADL